MDTHNVKTGYTRYDHRYKRCNHGYTHYNHGYIRYNYEYIRYMQQLQQVIHIFNVTK